MQSPLLSELQELLRSGHRFYYFAVTILSSHFVSDPLPSPFSFQFLSVGCVEYWAWEVFCYCFFEGCAIPRKPEWDEGKWEMKADRPINSVAEVATVSQENIAGCLVPQVVPERLSETIMSWNRFLSGSVCFLDSPIFCFSLIKTHSKGLWLLCTSPLPEAHAGSGISLGVLLLL